MPGARLKMLAGSILFLREKRIIFLAKNNRLKSLSSLYSFQSFIVTIKNPSFTFKRSFSHCTNKFKDLGIYITNYHSKSIRWVTQATGPLSIGFQFWKDMKKRFSFIALVGTSVRW